MKNKIDFAFFFNNALKQTNMPLSSTIPSVDTIQEYYTLDYSITFDSFNREG